MTLDVFFDRAKALVPVTARATDDLDRLEGQRFLLRMIAASVDTYVEQSDVDRPVFHHAEGPHRKMFADCPDTDYLRAPIRLGPGRVYRVSGRIPEGFTYAGVLLYGRGGRVGARLADTALRPDASGRFELRIGTEPTGDGVWLAAEGDETAVMVRQYFADRSREPPLDVAIELEGEAPPPAPLEAGWLDKQIERSTRMLEAIFARTVGAREMAKAGALNRFIDVAGEQLFPTPDNRYQICWFELADDQALRIRGRLPRVRYYGLSLCNAWMETFDYTKHTVSLNHAQLVTGDDGAFEVCVSHRDLGLPNRLDTAGHRSGYVVVRNLLLEGEPTELTAEVVQEDVLVSERRTVSSGTEK